MTFEVLVIPYSWIHSSRPNSKFIGLRQLINRSYDKPRYKFGIIQTPRIKTVDSLLNDLSIGIDDEICIYLLLGSQTIFDKLETYHGYIRDFSKEATNVEESFQCDIPADFYHFFNLDRLDSEVSVQVVDDDFELDHNVLRRVIASVGMRSFHGESDPKSKDFELTSFTSFMRNTAPRFLEYVINECLLDPERFGLLSRKGNLHDFESITLHADVIEEHNLVPYYVQNCGFEKSNKQSIKLTIDENKRAASGVLEDGILASRDFHIGFIHRTINIKQNRTV